jgi:hypothetical protein
VKTVFSIGALAFEGDLLASIFHSIGTKSEVIAVFHTNAGHVTLHDRALSYAFPV